MGNEGNAGEGQVARVKEQVKAQVRVLDKKGARALVRVARAKEQVKEQDKEQDKEQAKEQDGGQGDQGQGAGQEGNQQKEANMSLADIETALGMPLAEAKALLAAGKKPKEEPKGETLKGADLELAKMKALMQRNVPSGQIPVLLQFLNIAGTTPAEINASLDALAQAKMLPQEGQQQQGQGQGSTGLHKEVEEMHKGLGTRDCRMEASRERQFGLRQRSGNFARPEP